MKKRILFASLLLTFIVFVAAAVPLYSQAADKSGLVRLKLINKSGEPVNLQLTGDNFYYLTVDAASTKEFSVKADVYDRVTWTCGLSSSGTLDMSSQVKLVFMPCTQVAPNQGEPTMEKVSLFDSPTGIHWRYQDISD